MDDLYKEQLMDIYKNPAHRGTTVNTSISSHEENPMCGDALTISLQIVDNVIKDAKYDGSACIVSIVSSEMLLDFIIGKTVEEAFLIDKDKLLEILNLNLTTSRIKCATLVLTALKKALGQYERANKNDNKKSN